MEIIFFLILITLVLVGLIILAFFWAVDSGQFDDLEKAKHMILMDRDEIKEQSDKKSDT